MGLVVSVERLRVAVVEDYDVMRSLLVDDLTANGFQANGCADAAQLWRHLTRSPCDLVVLDVGLPDEDGFSVSRRLRGHSGVAVVMLTGYASTEHQILGVDQGADAYLIKPVESPILIATLKRVGQRLADREARGAVDSDGWRLADRGWLLRTPDQREIPLNAYERDLLHHLAAARGGAVTRARLQLALTRDPYPFDAERFDRVVTRLRQKVAALSECRLPLNDDVASASLCIASLQGAPDLLPGL